MAQEIDLKRLSLQAKTFDYVWFTFADLHGIARGKLVPGRHVTDALNAGAIFQSGKFVYVCMSVC